MEDLGIALVVVGGACSSAWSSWRIDAVGIVIIIIVIIVFTGDEIDWIIITTTINIIGYWCDTSFVIQSFFFVILVVDACIVINGSSSSSRSLACSIVWSEWRINAVVVVVTIITGIIIIITTGD